ncbi:MULTISPECIES: BatA domain-containing protein [unclassified Pedobacter]|uniref:BatA domain-containing protein n=1 Tax=unclassified Pedobacter TaxID=2628915 RepID=UPI001E43597C|nr:MULTISPECIES: BatA domain-containing protein [unclassified Pedobacter]
MQLFYPIGLLALAGLIIPLIIHLWNIKQGKTLKIGSISLLGESSRASSKSFKITDWLLFLLRCLLIILISFCIAQPYITRKVNTKEKGGWILIDKANFKSVYQSNRKTIDSLLKIRYEIHDFNFGFIPLSVKDTANTEKANVESLNFTSLFNLLTTILPSGTNIYIYQNTKQNNFGDNLPETKFNINWNVLNDGDSVKTWITDFAGKKLRATSTPKQTIYEAVNNQNLAPIYVAIYEDKSINDSKYLVAALNAIAQFTKRKIIINTGEKANQIGFWLSEKSVSSDFKSSIIKDGVLFKYAASKAVNHHSFINIEGKQIPLSKYIDSKNQFENLWTDGFGNPILSKEEHKNLKVLHFYSRFNPQWNDLVWNEAYVKALMPIVLQNEKPENFGFEANANDQRTLQANQLNTKNNNFKASESSLNINESVLKYFWIAALLIFIVERILSFRNKTDYAKN